MTKPLLPCDGTYLDAKRHYKRGEDIDEVCEFPGQARRAWANHVRRNQAKARIRKRVQLLKERKAQDD